MKLGRSGTGPAAHCACCCPFFDLRGTHHRIVTVPILPVWHTALTAGYPAVMSNIKTREQLAAVACDALPSESWGCFNHKTLEWSSLAASGRPAGLHDWVRVEVLVTCIISFH